MKEAATALSHSRWMRTGTSATARRFSRSLIRIRLSGQSQFTEPIHRCQLHYHNPIAGITSITLSQLPTLAL